jgi:hypothetical protein
VDHQNRPFPIILFRDMTINNNEDENLYQLDSRKPKNGSRKTNINHSFYSQNEQINKTNTTMPLRASIGNNVNNKMINYQIQDKENSDLIGSNNYDINEKVKFNNSMIRVFPNKSTISDPGNNTKKKVIIRNEYLLNNVNTNYTIGPTNPKDYIAMNNNLLYSVYNNMNNANNVNSSFYKNLQNSFAQAPQENTTNTNNFFYKNNSNNNNYNTNVNTNNRYNSLNNPVPKRESYTKINNNNTQYYQSYQIQNKKMNSNNMVTYPDLLSQSVSLNTAPIERNLTKIPMADSNIFFNDKMNTQSNSNKTYNCVNAKNVSPFASSCDDNEETQHQEEMEEFNPFDKPYRFKNLVIKKPKKIKGNLDKFKSFQNMGNYIPSGKKFVSYLKFPETKNISNRIMTASTISSSLTSGSNRLVGIDKNIIKNPAELDEISTKIQKLLNKKSIKYKLLYRASVDGDLSTTFHYKCNKAHNTLVLVYASSKKRFGGFTTQTWEGENVNKKDKNCFIFSIDKKMIYDVIEGHDAINCNEDLGPVFIDQIKLLDKFFTQGGTTSKRGKTFKTLEDFEITEGAEKFGVKEVEVYQIK